MIHNYTFYKFIELKDQLDPKSLKSHLEPICSRSQVMGTIILAPEGINGQISGTQNGVEMFWAELTSLEPFRDLNAKISTSEKIPFTRMKIKTKPAIIPMRLGDREFKVQPQVLTGKRIMPKELKTWYDEGRDFHIVDTRNNYEVEFGTFDNAINYGVRHFQNLVEVIEKNKTELKKKPVVMFCTGGIRCEKATALALKLGIDEVYQLEGGILKYFEECGGAHYKGSCFVFDERIALRNDLTAV